MCGSRHIRTNLTQIYIVRTKASLSARLYVSYTTNLVVIADQYFGDLYSVRCCTFAHVVSHNP